jgi:lipopolysaccharide export system permease protein
MGIIKKLNKRLYIYIFKEIFYILLLSLGIFTFILVLARIGKIADLVINKGVGLKDIVLLIVYSSPPYLTFTLPMSFLLATIVVLGRLSSENETLVLKTSGISMHCLFVPVTVMGVLIAFIGLLNTNFIIPRNGELFRTTLVNIVKKGIAIEDKEGIFNDTIPGVVIYIDKVDVQHKYLSGILVSDDRDKDLKQVISAKKGYINMDPVSFDLRFVLEEGNLHRWEKVKDTYRNVAFKNYTYSMNLTNMMPNTRDLRKKHYEMDREELQKTLIQANEHQRYDILLEIAKKISIPLSSLSFIFITIPLGIRRKTEGKFSGAVYSIMIFVFYYILMIATEKIGEVVHLSPSITSFLPNIAIALLGFSLVRNMNYEESYTLSNRLKSLWGHYFEKVG